MRKFYLCFLKISQLFSLLVFIALSCFFASCASSRPPQEKAAATAKAPSQVPEKKPALPERPPAGDGLDSPQLRNLPPEAKVYLKTLAESFRKRDKEFLISQGESQYEKDLRHQFDDETYLALLYRAGPYSEDLEWKTPAPFKLEYTKILTIAYTRWEERGPLLDIKARLYLADSTTLPCGIMLVWRLTEPKILGERP